MYKSIKSISARHRRRLKQKLLLNVPLNHKNRRDQVSSELVSVEQQNLEVSAYCNKHDTQEANCALPIVPIEPNNDNIFESDQDFDLEDLLSKTSSEVSSCDTLNSNDYTLKDQGNGDSYLTYDLKDWTLECKLPQTHITKLLGVLRKYNIKVPQDARTLMNTQRYVNTISVPPGNYSHLGIKTQILKLLAILPQDFQIPSCIKIVINVDGLPLSKSSGSQFWPIIAWFANSNFEWIFMTKTFVVGVYHGYTKPKSPNEFLNQFCQEIIELQENGFLFRNRTLHINISHIVCDAPARAYITCTKSHTGYHGCSKCIQEGEFKLNRMTFPDPNSTPRTDDSFRTKSDEYHHTGISLLENLNIGMVTQIPIDYMHLVCLGVTKRLFQFWHKGRQDVRIPTSLFSDLSEIIVNFKQYISSDFSRKPRTLFEVVRFKATEFRQLLLYTGVVALKGILSDDQYSNFLHISCAIRILITPDLCMELNESAQNVLHDFVVSYGELYG
ncbi:unnamed protein product [Psylliodes chrysocephalus]|uniref:Transposase domain-containing protein n=1 Tax=Psylliodes chrysocephalus TaxID=3402493 RepID=A0A9P0CT45_9CUCU|nr:unnamed protein product [Psylliodes chrysocephala]